MKKLVSVVLSLLLLAALSGSALAEDGRPLDETAFPDEALRGALAVYDTDEDGALSEEEIAAVTALDLSNGGAGLGIRSLDGLEAFSALTELNLSGNPVANLNLDGFSMLEKLNVSHTELKALSLSSCPALRELNAAAVGIESLDLTPCTALAALVQAGEGAEETDEYTNTAGETVSLALERYDDGMSVLVVPAAASVTPARPVPPCGEHSWDEGAVTTEPGCETEGVKTFTCTVCGETRTEAMEALGHDYVWTVTTEPGCETDGEETEVCSHDESHTRDTRALPATGHNWDEGAVTTEPGCETEGVKTFTCLNCGATRTEAIEAQGHDYVWTVTTEPGCASVGEETEICSRDASHTRATRELPAAGHRWDDGAATVPAACERAGVRTFTCLNCGETRTEAIPALSHAWDEGSVTKAATCTEPGSMLYTCRNDASHTRTAEIPAAGHRFEGGLCTVCGAAQPGFIPRITEGNGGVAHYGSDYVLRCSAAFSTFQGVTVDGNIVERDNYKLTSDSTVVTLSADYIRTLSAGSHTVALNTVLGAANGAFSVSTSPKTGDTANIWLWAALLGVSAAAIAAAVILLTRRNRRNKKKR